MAVGRPRFPHYFLGGLTGSYIWELHAAKDASISAYLYAPLWWAGNGSVDRLFLAATGSKKGPPGVAVDWPRFPQDSSEIAEHSLGVDGAIYLGPKRG